MHKFSKRFESATNIPMDLHHSKRAEAGIACIELKEGATPVMVGPSIGL